VNPDADAEQVVADLEGVLAHLEELKAACETYKVRMHACICACMHTIPPRHASGAPGHKQ
jgi:hypothetical protein